MSHQLSHFEDITAFRGVARGVCGLVNISKITTLTKIKTCC